PDPRHRRRPDRAHVRGVLRGPTQGPQALPAPRRRDPRAPRIPSAARAQDRPGGAAAQARAHARGGDDARDGRGGPDRPRGPGAAPAVDPARSVIRASGPGGGDTLAASSPVRSGGTLRRPGRAATRRISMRTTLLATASSALAAAALLAGAGTAGADEAETDGPVCIVVDTFTGAKRTMCLTPEEADAVSSLGYGSAGTGS